MMGKGDECLSWPFSDWIVHRRAFEKVLTVEAWPYKKRVEVMSVKATSEPAFQANC
jgi:hypothetical protein